MAKITDRQINAKPSHIDKWLSETAIWGHGSLVVRITPAGERLFYFRYRNTQGKRVTHPIGTYGRDGADGTMTLAEASLKAKELAGLHKSSTKDIREHLQAEEAIRVANREAEQARLEKEKAEAQAALEREAARRTVADLFEHWASVDLINRRDGGKEVRRIIEKDVLPLIGHLAVEDVTKGHITEITDTLLTRGVNRMAKMTFSLMRQMFRFAVDRDLIEHEPTANIRKTKIGGKNVERDRIVSEDEIRQLAHQLPSAGLVTTSEAAVWIALSTCCRIGELLQAEWEHIDFELRTWLIPRENSKNGKPHTVYLSDLALAQFMQIQLVNGHSQWCYPNRSNTGPVSTKTITKQLTDRQLQPGKKKIKGRSSKSQTLILSGGRWTPHDLRRTGATMMTALGVLPEVAERCLNHMEENRVKRTYQRHSYIKEMRKAWQLLGNRLEILTTSDSAKVVMFKR